MSAGRDFASRSCAFIDGAGAGPGATHYANRTRDVGAYEAMAASLPKKPPRPALADEPQGDPVTRDSAPEGL